MRAGLAEATESYRDEPAASTDDQTEPAGYHGRELVPNERFGDYLVVRRLVHGGMGIVYEAIQESLHRRVALKVISRQLSIDAEYCRRFQQEARLVGKLHHVTSVFVIVILVGKRNMEGIQPLGTAMK